jgi:hypothetical protein
MRLNADLKTIDTLLANKADLLAENEIGQTALHEGID